MNIERIDDLIFRARAEAAAKIEAQPGSERDRLLRVAQEFESMLMLQMLKEMRKAGSWDEEEGKSGYGAETMLDTIDVELAGHLARSQGGLGLGKQMLGALQRMDGGESTKTESAPSADPVLEIPEGTVTSGYGWRQDPIHGAARFHRGIDIRAAYGQDVPSAASGRVISAGTEGGYGQTVVVEHAGGVRTRYAHLSMTMVAAGDEVGEGQVIGRAGRSGRATGTHLHFEVTSAGGDALNPEYFSKLKAEREVADFTRASNSVLQETRR